MVAVGLVAVSVASPRSQRLLQLFLRLDPIQVVDIEQPFFRPVGLHHEQALAQLHDCITVPLHEHENVQDLEQRSVVRV